MNNPNSIQKLVNLFSKFPTVGKRTAGRFVFYLIGLPEKEIEELTYALVELKKQIRLCKFCFNSFEDKEDNLCEICSDAGRDSNTLCVVANETDLAAIEKTKKYRGLYFVLGGTVSALKKKDIEKLRVEELKNRIEKSFAFLGKNANFKEIILALNPTAEGQATTFYLERILRPLNVKITKLALGLPLGGELEYADEETLEAAFEGRK